jgi:hypothetical protein
MLGYESFGRPAVVTLRIRNACSVPFRGARHLLRLASRRVKLRLMLCCALRRL